MIDVLRARFEDIEELICSSGVVKNIIDSVTTPGFLDITEMIGFQREVDSSRGIIIKRKHRHILSISLMITYKEDTLKPEYQTFMIIQLPGRYVLGYDCDDTGRLTDSGRLHVYRSAGAIIGNKIVSLRKDEVNPYLRINDLLEMYRNKKA